MKKSELKNYHEMALRVFSTKEGIALFNKLGGSSVDINKQYEALVKADLELNN